MALRALGSHGGLEAEGQGQAEGPGGRRACAAWPHRPRPTPSAEASQEPRLCLGVRPANVQLDQHTCRLQGPAPPNPGTEPHQATLTPAGFPEARGHLRSSHWGNNNPQARLQPCSALISDGPQPPRLGSGQRRAAWSRRKLGFRGSLCEPPSFPRHWCRPLICRGRTPQSPRGCCH